MDLEIVTGFEIFPALTTDKTFEIQIKVSLVILRISIEKMFTLFQVN